MPVLARAVREVEAAAQRGPASPSVRNKYQVIALLVRQERARVKADETLTEPGRAEQLKRLDGVARILAETGARDTSLLVLLAEDAVISEGAKALQREMLAAGGIDVPEPEPTTPDPVAAAASTERRVVPQSVVARQLANPFLAPDFSATPTRKPQVRRLANWELIEPLLRSFEYGGSSASMALPDPEPPGCRTACS